MRWLDRFKTAQDERVDGFDAALAEMRAGRKHGHWIWYVFPQLAGLGGSHLSHLYGIDGPEEAAEYLQDPVLRDRLLTITKAVEEQVTGGRSLDTLMGSAIDVRKLVSSLTLFSSVARRLHDTEGLEDYQSLARAADEVLAVAATEGYPLCPYTLARLEG